MTVKWSWGKQARRSLDGGFTGQWKGRRVWGDRRRMEKKRKKKTAKKKEGNERVYDLADELLWIRKLGLGTSQGPAILLRKGRQTKEVE